MKNDSNLPNQSRSSHTTDHNQSAMDGPLPSQRDSDRRSRSRSRSRSRHHRGERDHRHHRNNDDRRRWEKKRGGRERSRSRDRSYERSRHGDGRNNNGYNDRGRDGEHFDRNGGRDNRPDNCGNFHNDNMGFHHNSNHNGNGPPPRDQQHQPRNYNHHQSGPSHLPVKHQYRVNPDAKLDEKLHQLQVEAPQNEDPRGDDPTKRITQKAKRNGAGRNTESFDPADTLVRPDLRVWVGSNEKRGTCIEHDAILNCKTASLTRAVFLINSFVSLSTPNTQCLIRS